MEVLFPSLAEWEQFLAAIPSEQHLEWSRRMQVCCMPRCLPDMHACMHA